MVEGRLAHSSPLVFAELGSPGRKGVFGDGEEAVKLTKAFGPMLVGKVAADPIK